MLVYNFDPAKGRLHIKYLGFWTDAQASAAHLEFADHVQRIAATHGEFTLLDDLTEWMPQSQSVVQSNIKFGQVCAMLPIRRNAMIVPSALVRRQVIRTVDGLDCQIFEDFDSADLWLREAEPTRGRSIPAHG